MISIKIFIVNGKGSSGKTTAENMIVEIATAHGKKVEILSTIDYVKEIAKGFGWDGSKEPKDRKNIVKAIFLTTVIVILVLSLLISADTEFAKLFKNILKAIEKLSVPELLIRIGVIILLFFYIASFFINMLSKNNIEGEI